jgi:DnaJ-class molecular chaperone
MKDMEAFVNSEQLQKIMSVITEGSETPQRSPTLREAASGTCPRCAGSGKVEFNSGRRYPCGLCNGSGHV